MSGAYNAGTSHRLAKLSAAVYLDESEAVKAARSIGADDVEFFERQDTECMVSRFGPDVFLVFRGTEPAGLVDLMTDAKIKLIRSDGITGAVHRGFAASAATVINSVCVAVDRFRGIDGFVYIGGHSKGGAEALLTAKRLYERFENTVPIAAVHVFGCPSVGGAEFCESYDSALGARSFRHVYRSDMVARSPVLLRLLGAYRAVGRVVYHSENLREFKPSLMRRLSDVFRAISRRRWLSDHAVANYVEATKL